MQGLAFALTFTSSASLPGGISMLARCARQPSSPSQSKALQLQTLHGNVGALQAARPGSQCPQGERASCSGRCL